MWAGDREEVGMAIKGAARDACGVGTVQCLFGGGINANLHRC